MNIASKQQLASRLPYDAEVEYLESTGVQYLKSGINSVGSMPLSFSSRFAINQMASSAFTLFGSEIVDSGSYIMEWARIQTAGFAICNRMNFTSKYTQGSLIDVSLQTDGVNYTVNYNGINEHGSLNQNKLNNREWYVFGRNNGKSADTMIKCSMYHLSISDFDRGLLRDFIPVRFTNENNISEGAMYDRVSGQLFRNQGTGAFIIGPDKRKQEAAE